MVSAHHLQLEEATCNGRAQLALGGLVITHCAACRAAAETYLETRPTGVVEQELSMNQFITAKVPAIPACA